MKKILLYGLAREESSRIEHKMIKDFGASRTCLYEIYLKKFENIAKMDNPFCDIYMGISKSDSTLWHLSRDSTIKIAERTTESVSPGYRGVIDVHECIRNYDYDYIMSVNGCFPFLKEKTIMDAAEFFQNLEELKSMTCGVKRYNFFWDDKLHKPINNSDIKNFSTSNVNPLIEQVHCFHIYNKEFLFKNNRFWDFKENDPYMYIVDDTIEFIDVDNIKDFKICEAIYDKKN